MACPTSLQGGFLGAFLGYWHEGYSWPANWQLDRILEPAHHSIADYLPRNRPTYLVSRGGGARWHQPRITVACTVTERWLRGRIVLSTDRYQVTHNHGYVEPCTGAGGGDTPVDHEAYDPYASSQSTSSSGSADDCGGGGGGDQEEGGGPGSGTDLWAIPTGGAGPVCGGGAVVYDYLCVDRWNPTTQQWEEYWCGTAAFCA